MLLLSLLHPTSFPLLLQLLPHLVILLLFILGSHLLLQHGSILGLPLLFTASLAILIAPVLKEWIILFLLLHAGYFITAIRTDS